jgi:hypothetical protein
MIPPKLLSLELKELVLEGYYAQPIYKNVLPDSLEKLVITSNFNHPFDIGELPCDLKHLIFGDDDDYFRSMLTDQSIEAYYHQS